jgi:hypothetical protein
MTPSEWDSIKSQGESTKYRTNPKEYEGTSITAINKYVHK